MDDKIKPFPGSERTRVVNSLRQFFGVADDIKLREIKKARVAFYALTALVGITAIAWAAHLAGSASAENRLREEFSMAETRHLNAYNARLIKLRNQWAAQIENIQQHARQRVAGLEQELQQQQRESNARIRQLREDNAKFRNYYDAQVPADVPGIIWDSLRADAAADSGGN